LVSNQLKEELFKLLKNVSITKLNDDEIKELLINLYENLHILVIKNLEKLKKLLEGTTMTLIIVTASKIITSNLGDSKSVLISKNTLTQLSYEHKSFDRNEYNEYKSKGGYISSNGRVNGIISISRALGNTFINN
jgi:serine/threonine protein phosphatase PrpC